MLTNIIEEMKTRPHEFWGMLLSTLTSTFIVLSYLRLRVAGKLPVTNRMRGIEVAQIGGWMLAFQFWLPPQFDPHEPWTPLKAVIAILGCILMAGGFWFMFTRDTDKTVTNSDVPQSWPPKPTDVQ